MRVGLMFPPRRDPADVVGFARRAEAAGFDYLACGEHVFFRGPITNAFVTLAAAAGATQRIRLLSALTILPVYPPALVAKLVASLDRVSAGRFDLGVGVGGEYPPEFDAVGVAMSQRGTRTDETLRLMSALFAGGPVDFVGEFVRIKALIMEPAPVQRPGPPVWVGGRSERSMRRAAEFGDVWLPYLVTPDQLAAGVVKIGQLTGGRRRVRAGVYCWAAVDPNGDVARRTAQQVVGELYGQDFSSMSRYLLAGDPGEVISRVSQYVAAGTEELVFAPACPEEHVDAMVDRFAADVLPTIRALGPRREVNV